MASLTFFKDYFEIKLSIKPEPSDDMLEMYQASPKQFLT